MPASVAKEPAGVHHTGRGGGGNLVGVRNESKERSSSKDRPRPEAKTRTSSGVFDKAKELVGLKK